MGHGPDSAGSSYVLMFQRRQGSCTFNSWWITGSGCVLTIGPLVSFKVTCSFSLGFQAPRQMQRCQGLNLKASAGIVDVPPLSHGPPSINSVGASYVTLAMTSISTQLWMFQKTFPLHLAAIKSFKVQVLTFPKCLFFKVTGDVKDPHLRPQRAIKREWKLY